MRIDDGMLLMDKLKALDLFCGAGGATRGLMDAGCHVTGVDLMPQPRYCGDEFVRFDALAFLRSVRANKGVYDFIWASPPCQKHTALKTMHNALPHIDLIAPTRELLKATGLPYVIENVVGAPLVNPVCLCGSMFGLTTPCGAELRRHRIFEASFPISAPACAHRADADVIGIYGGHYRNRRRAAGRNREAPDFTADDGRSAMGIDWMTGSELSQAIPPAYSHFIAMQWLIQRGVEEMSQNFIGRAA